VPPADIEELPPPLPPPHLPAIRTAVDAFKINGARADENGGSVTIGTRLYRSGDIVDTVNSIIFVGFEKGVITFRDTRGAFYTRRF
jgi:hypothetical protein